LVHRLVYQIVLPSLPALESPTIREHFLADADGATAGGKGGAMRCQRNVRTTSSMRRLACLAPLKNRSMSGPGRSPSPRALSHRDTQQISVHLR
jgi:hypothetical protein